LKKFKNWIIGGISAIAISVVAMSANAALTLELPGAHTFDPGTAHKGWTISESSETSTGNTTAGTLTTFAIPGSSTAYLVADVVGQAGTGTARLSMKVSGTFDRDGTDTMTSVGTATLDSDMSAAMGGIPAYWTTGTDNSAQLMVIGTNTKMTWAATVKSLVVTTTGAE
jgi:hypothetical protein